jgi:hypothetical protein
VRVQLMTLSIVVVTKPFSVTPSMVMSLKLSGNW